MKRSEKVKGKERVAQKRKQYWMAGIAIAAVVIIGIVLFFTLFSPFGAKTGDTVSVYYIGTLDNGTVFDSNMNGTPLSFTLGQGMLITGFEDAVMGMSAGDQKTVRIPVEKAYGPYRADLVHDMSRSIFPANETPVIGQMYTFKRTGSNTVNRFIVTNFNDTAVTIDENHVLAGQNLTFTIRVVSVSKGTAS
ncbi:MAG: peptidylprolyl isomerase [Methanoregula sp.]|nr:peptidylprolyl isomerase [Methanoregula sp.]